MALAKAPEPCGPMAEGVGAGVDCRQQPKRGSNLKWSSTSPSRWNFPPKAGSASAGKVTVGEKEVARGGFQHVGDGTWRIRSPADRKALLPRRPSPPADGSPSSVKLRAPGAKREGPPAGVWATPRVPPGSGDSSVG